MSSRFLLTDLDLANTFLDIAEATDNEDTRKRNIKNARKAHDAVTYHASKAHLADSELLMILEVLHALRKRLGEIEGRKS